VSGQYWLRFVLFGIGFAWINFGPIYTQVFHQGKTRWTRTWQMYRGHGTDLCQVAFYQRLEEGDAPLDRLELLGHPNGKGAPKSVRRLPNREAVRMQARHLCVRLEAPRDVRADARCATRSGWKTAFEREENLCTFTPGAPARRPR
jgi:hypothetical protein